MDGDIIVWFLTGVGVGLSVAMLGFLALSIWDRRALARQRQARKAQRMEGSGALRAQPIRLAETGIEPFGRHLPHSSSPDSHIEPDFGVGSAPLSVGQQWHASVREPEFSLDLREIPAPALMPEPAGPPAAAVAPPPSEVPQPTAEELGEAITAINRAESLRLEAPQPVPVSAAEVIEPPPAAGSARTTIRRPPPPPRPTPAASRPRPSPAPEPARAAAPSRQGEPRPPAELSRAATPAPVAPAPSTASSAATRPASARPIPPLRRPGEPARTPENFRPILPRSESVRPARPAQRRPFTEITVPFEGPAVLAETASERPETAARQPGAGSEHETRQTPAPAIAQVPVEKSERPIAKAETAKASDAELAPLMPPPAEVATPTTSLIEKGVAPSAEDADAAAAAAIEKGARRAPSPPVQKTDKPLPKMPPPRLTPDTVEAIFAEAFARGSTEPPEGKS